MSNRIAIVDQLELAESEVVRLIDVAHRQGLNYWQILDIFLRACVNLHLQASTEYMLHLKDTS